MNMLTPILILSILSCVYSWELNATHSNILPGLTAQVELTCFHVAGRLHNQPELKLINRIRILKLGKANQWHTFALKGLSTNLPSIKPSGSEITVTGLVGQPMSSYLSIKWETSNEATVGTYKCEVDGFNFNDDVKTSETAVLNITAQTPSVNDLLDLYLNAKKDLEEISSQRSANFASEADKRAAYDHLGYQGTAGRHISDRIELEVLLQDLAQDLKDRIKSKVEESFYERRMWPLGDFALPAPQGGCPESQYDKWETSSIKISLEATPLAPRIMTTSNLMKPVIENNYFYLRFCQKSSTSRGMLWPKGSYCIYTGKTGACPTYFHSGHITLSDPTNNMRVSAENGTYYTVSGRTFSPYFCCRNDSPADNPIRLPTGMSFYLYRFNGQCQSVSSTTVTPEWIDLATHNSNPTYANEYHPDGNSTILRLEMCYYQAKIL